MYSCGSAHQKKSYADLLYCIYLRRAGQRSTATSSAAINRACVYPTHSPTHWPCERTLSSHQFSPTHTNSVNPFQRRQHAAEIRSQCSHRHLRPDNGRRGRCRCLPGSQDWSVGFGKFHMLSGNCVCLHFSFLLAVYSTNRKAES